MEVDDELPRDVLGSDAHAPTRDTSRLYESDIHMYLVESYERAEGLFEDDDEWYSLISDWLDVETNKKIQAMFNHFQEEGYSGDVILCGLRDWYQEGIRDNSFGFEWLFEDNIGAWLKAQGCRFESEDSDSERSEDSDASFREAELMMANELRMALESETTEVSVPDLTLPPLPVTVVPPVPQTAVSSLPEGAIPSPSDIKKYLFDTYERATSRRVVNDDDYPSLRTWLDTDTDTKIQALTIHFESLGYSDDCVCTGLADWYLDYTGSHRIYFRSNIGAWLAENTEVELSEDELEPSSAALWVSARRLGVVASLDDYPKPPVDSQPE